MRILHTSDWHIGRTFHGHSTDAHLSEVLAALADAVREHGVDAVVVAGDVFDSSTPKAEAFTMLNAAVRAIRDAGATVILTSGNHDGPARLGHMAEFAAFGGVHVMADLARLATPVTLEDAHGEVHLYGIPYVHPEFLRAAYEDFDGTTHGDALAFAMGLIRDDAAARGGRFIVASHCFAGRAGEAPGETTELSGRAEERDISRGGLNLVDLSVFDGPDYVALGHIHSHQTLSERVRYSGAPLRFSFGEISSDKIAWLVDLDASGLAAVERLALPTPRRAVRLEGTLEELLSPDAHADATEAWVEAILTDDQLPRDAMRALQGRFPYAVTLTHRPAHRADHGDAGYAERVEGRTDLEIVDEFLGFVRNGAALSADERGLVTDALAALESAEAAR
ncbi:exonuclease SbcCD subunit D [Demequina mangrovi]|uniref:Nuclease SbcCD subunit D n=1 Tax=Demequina mangrovi TaxID=1043493 RepID=A0A1H6ZC56_9MICO|nr:exonuclease SbcCD subunit D C-terminal domain-containing protein [Demequina mangrovi]SEJ51039.1 Exodeoxyribonuclease I subunit D [Demequina mangrovi]